MSRRKQTNPFKVNWLFHTPGLADSEHTLEMDVRDDFAEDSECHSNNSQEAEEQDSMTDESYSDLDNHGEDSSSNTSADDIMTGHKQRRHCSQEGGVKEECKEGGDFEGNYMCPLCTLEFRHSEQLIAHVYQHTSSVGGSKSFVCPVCGRALSSPGSLGRHLLIHSEDRLSNCAVCGTRFTDTTNFNREKLKDFFNSSSMDLSVRGRRPAPSAGPPEPDARVPGRRAAGVQQLCGLPAAGGGPLPGHAPVGVAAAQRAPGGAHAPPGARAHGQEEQARLRVARGARAAAPARPRGQAAAAAAGVGGATGAAAAACDREAMRLKRANETPEKRQARLVREREAKRLKRRLEKIEPGLRVQIEHDPAAMAALTADMSLFQFPYPLQGGVTPPASAPSSLDNGLFMRLAEPVPQLPLALRPLGSDCKMGISESAQNQ
ncbi:hypothetical protein AALO_G00191300 [Alosa alosa]|uniref:C2H2-type domain-containing protein n=1 Tax=Alosa alosa TaxID=278164 RepID=A0AAV6G5B4_9TELE|nr:hypothetical protein AALO_G00191300 [Alosa alosa]